MRLIGSILKLAIYASFWVEYHSRRIVRPIKKAWKWAVKGVEDYHEATSKMTPEERMYLDDTNLFI